MMSDYKKMYFSLFHAVTAAIEQLQSAQIEGEEAYMKEDLPFSVFTAKEKPGNDK